MASVQPQLPCANSLSVFFKVYADCNSTLFRMPTGQGYTVESQITGNDIVGGLMFEVTPAHRKRFFLLQGALLAN